MIEQFSKFIGINTSNISFVYTDCLFFTICSLTNFDYSSEWHDRLYEDFSIGNFNQLENQQLQLISTSKTITIRSGLYKIHRRRENWMSTLYIRDNSDNMIYIFLIPKQQ